MQNAFTLDAQSMVVWRADLRAIGQFPNFSANLDPTEAKRASAFVFDRDRRRYTAGRTFLKGMLAQYLRCLPGAVRIAESERGKPFLAAPARTLEFNVSHCEDIYVLAITRRAQVGIDIELAREVDDAQELARSVFSPAERRQLDEAGGRVSAAFLRGWTRKEAYVKALGVGIGVELPAIHVGLESGSRLVAVPDLSGPPLLVQSLQPDDLAHIAVACGQEISNTVCFDVDHDLVNLVLRAI